MFAKLDFSLTDKRKQNCKSKLICLLDTGATCNLISYRDVCVLLQTAEPPLENSTVRPKLFDGSIMKPLGQLELLVKHIEKSEQSRQFWQITSH